MRCNKPPRDAGFDAFPHRVDVCSNPAFDLGSERAAADDRQQEPDAARFQQRSGVNQKKRGLLMVQWGYADQAR